MNKKLKKNQVIIYKKKFTKEEVKEIGNIIGFFGIHHEKENERGQLLNQGILTATLTNKIGGEYNVLGYNMEFDFIEKVYTDEEITCESKVLDIFEKNGKNHVIIESHLYNEDKKLVLRGILKGILL